MLSLFYYLYALFTLYSKLGFGNARVLVEKEKKMTLGLVIEKGVELSIYHETYLVEPIFSLKTAPKYQEK